jgi:hypothetical protein
MKRDPRAFLDDVIDAGSAIMQAVDDMSLNDYLAQLSQREKVCLLRLNWVHRSSASTTSSRTNTSRSTINWFGESLKLIFLCLLNAAVSCFANSMADTRQAIAPAP